MNVRSLIFCVLFSFLTVFGGFGCKGVGESLRKFGDKLDKSMDPNAKAEDERQKQMDQGYLNQVESFLTSTPKTTSGGHVAWVKRYESARNICDTNIAHEPDEKDVWTARKTKVSSHYLAESERSIASYCEEGNGIGAHYLARALPLEAHETSWAPQKEKIVELMKLAASIRTKSAQGLYAAVQRYAEPNEIDAAASPDKLPDGNLRIDNITYHVKLGQRIWVRCYTPTRISSWVTGKEKPYLAATVRCYQSEVTPEFSYTIPVDIDAFYDKDYFDVYLNTGKQSEGISPGTGSINVILGLTWTSGYEELWDGNRVILQPILSEYNATLTMSFEK